MATADHRSDPSVAAGPGRAPGTDPGQGTESAPGIESASGTQPAPGTETEPDARYTFANERTFLAWTRTALAFILAGLGIVQLLPPFPGVPWGRHLLGVPLIAIGAIIAVVGYREWASNQRALRRREPVRRSPVPRLLAAAIVCMAIITAVVLLLSAILKH
jgi:putative membrane protein